MSLIDEYQNAGETEEPIAGDHPETSRRQRAELERQIVILNSDLKKIIREMEDLEAQRRRFKKEEQRIRIERDELDRKYKKLDDDKRLLEEEIGSLKKKLKTLT